MRHASFALPLSVALLAACGDSSAPITNDFTGGTDAGRDGSTSGGRDGGPTGNDGAITGDGAPSTGCGTCPTGYTCGSANGLAVCRSADGIPLFSHEFVILMENTSYDTLDKSTNTPNLHAMKMKYASGTDYHGVTHPSLPNYMALVSGSDQGIGCDCNPTGNACSGVTCNRILGSCGCSQADTVKNVADQIEAAGKTWMAFGESMGTPCNTTTSGDYAARHVPFLYFDDVQKDMTRCTSHVVDYTGFDPDKAGDFTFIAPNLTDDMHSPAPAGAQNLANGDNFIGPLVDKITKSASYTSGGLLVVVWDEDDNSGIPTADAPIPIFVLSPYAKNGGFQSSTKADHYALLKTIEQGLGITTYLGSAATATPLADYFPAQ